jgi:Holliday junction resolvasome RuvABC endonuclease subunit
MTTKTKIMGLDISSSTIGWSLFTSDQSFFSLDDYGFVKPIKGTPAKPMSLSKRLKDAKTKIDALIDTHKPDIIVIEDYARRFSAGRSSAQTIIVLSVFNETISLLGYEKLNKDVVKYPVVSIRAELSKFFKQKIVSKEDIGPVIIKNSTKFKQVTSKNGIRKENEDIIDAIAVGLTYILKEIFRGQNYTL